MLEDEGREPDPANDPSEPPESFDNRLPSVIGGLRLANRPDLAEWIEDSVWRVDDLLTEEAAEKLAEIEKVPNFGPMIVKDFQAYIDVAEAERKRVAEEEAAEELGRIKAEEKARLEQERADRRVRDERKAIRAQILEEERQARIAAGQSPPANPMDDALALVDRAAQVIDSPHTDLETKHLFASDAIAALEQAEPGSKTNPIDVDPDEFLKQFNAEKE